MADFWVRSRGSWFRADKVGETGSTVTVEIPDELVEVIRQADHEGDSVVVNKPFRFRLQKTALNAIGWYPLTLRLRIRKPSRPGQFGHTEVTEQAIEILTSAGRHLFDPEYQAAVAGTRVRYRRRSGAVPDTRSEIMTWFREEARKLHPDLGGSGDPDAMHRLIGMRNAMLERLRRS